MLQRGISSFETAATGPFAWLTGGLFHNFRKEGRGHDTLLTLIPTTINYIAKKQQQNVLISLTLSLERLPR